MATDSDNYLKLKTKLEDGALQEIIKKALPSTTSAGAWTAAALAYLRTNEDILNCTTTSVIGCCITVASFGLRLDGVTGHAYLRALAIKDSAGNILRHEAQVQLGYRGMLELAYRNPEVREIEPVIVHKEDLFDFEKGTSPFLHHKWEISKPRGVMVAVYAGIRFKGGYYSFQIHAIEDIMNLRKNILQQSYIRVEETQTGTLYYKKPYKGSDWRELSSFEANRYPWIGHLGPMILKTAIRWSQKFWPTVNTEFSYASTLSELDDAGLPQEMSATAERYGVTDAKPEAKRSFDPEIKGDLKERMLAGLKSNSTSVPEPETTPETAPEPAPETKVKPAVDLAPGEQRGLFSEPKVPRVDDPDRRSKPHRGRAVEPEKVKPNKTNEPTEEEKAQILRREREEWEASQRKLNNK